MNSRQKCKEWRIIILKYKGSLKPAWHVQTCWTQFIEFNKLNRAISRIWQFSALFFLNSISWKYQTCFLLSRNWIHENILTCCIVLMFYYIFNHVFLTSSFSTGFCNLPHHSTAIQIAVGWFTCYLWVFQ